MTAFNNPDKKVAEEAAKIIGEAAVKELHNIADAIYKLGVKQAPQPTVTYENLYIELGAVADAFQGLVDDSDLNTLQKFETIRKLTDQIRKRASMYMEKWREEQIAELEEQQKQEEENNGSDDS